MAGDWAGGAGALSRIAFGADALTDVLVGVARGDVPAARLPLVRPQRDLPDHLPGAAAPTWMSAAHEDGGPAGLEEQLGLLVEVKPFGLAGSAGPPRAHHRRRLTRPPLFGKLYARSHLRSDRWYKLGRELLYGRLEDEKPFNTVRRLVQQEDYALSLMQRAGLPARTSSGSSASPEREYLLVTEFFADATELGEAEVDTQVIDDGLGIIRKLWDAGLAHRDIKPANLLVREGRMRLIDVAFVQARPSPWRQAVDLANMMLRLALRSDPELVSCGGPCASSRSRRSPRASRPPAGWRCRRSCAGCSGPRAATCTPSSSACCRPRPSRCPSSAERSPGRASSPRAALGGVRRRAPRQQRKQRHGPGDAAGHRQPGLHRPGAAVAAGPGGALGVTGAVHPRPAGRLDAGRGGRQRRPLALTLNHDRAGVAALVAADRRLRPGGAVEGPSQTTGVRHYQQIESRTGQFTLTWYDQFPVLRHQPVASDDRP